MALPKFRLLASLGLRFITTRATIRDIMVNPPTPSTIVQAQGHIKNIRRFKNVGFIDINDGTHCDSLNVVLADAVELGFRVGQSVSVTGEWKESQGSQKYELVYDPNQPSHAISMVGDVPELYPLQKKSQTYQFLRSLPTLRHRTSTLASTLRLRSAMELKLNDFFVSEGCIKVSPPILTSSDCEGAGEQFEVIAGAKSVPGQADGFFGKPAYLTVSTQLHLEVLAASLNRVWTLTPCFRAENSHTNRHLSEFWMLEAELSYITQLSQLTSFTESMIKFAVRALIQNDSSGSFNDLAKSRFQKTDANALQQRWDLMSSARAWPVITYTDALDIINKIKLKGRLKGRLTWGDSIQTEHEKWIAGDHFKSPVFITDYPESEKPFYMPHSANFNAEKPTVACFDLILPEIGELIGGSLREHRYDALVAQMSKRNMSLPDMEWYLSTRLNGAIPHGGFGMGFDRLIGYLSAVDNIKDVIPFPRVPDSIQC